MLSIYGLKPIKLHWVINMYYYCGLVYHIDIIIRRIQVIINCLCILNVWVLFGGIFCQLMEQLCPLTGNLLAFFHERHKHFLLFEHVVSAQEASTALNRENSSFFPFVYIILCLPFHKMHKHLMFGIMLCHLVEQIQPLTGNPFDFFCFMLFILILCIPVHENHKHFLVLEHVVSNQDAATA